MKQIHKSLMEHDVRMELKIQVLDRSYLYQKMPRCESVVSEKMLKFHKRCMGKALYNINGVNMCERHAGRECLRYYLQIHGLKPSKMGYKSKIYAEILKQEADHDS